MKIAILCKGTLLQPALEALHYQRLLAGVAVPEMASGSEIHQSLESAVRQAGVPLLRVPKTHIEEQLIRWLTEISPDAVFCMGFPWKIPASLLDLPPLGFFNFHGGTLPQYRGPDPVFWQIKNGETCGAISVHRMTAEIDRGSIALTERLPIISHETYGLHMQRMGATLPRLTIEFMQQLAIRGRNLTLQEQVDTSASYHLRPSHADRTVDWTQSAAQIDALVRACNPVYLGALTVLKGVPIRLLQVSAAPSVANSNPCGTIIEASIENGIRVACGSGESLFLDIICSDDGFFTGNRLVKIFGLQPGDRMT